MGRRIWTLTAILVLLLTLWPVSEVRADETSPRYYLGTLTNAGRDTGYAEEHEIGGKDPHFGWELGRFFISGYTSTTGEESPVFLKTPGDEVTLWFQLDQDIDCLNGHENLTISRDKNGFDRYFGVEQTDFGRGTLIVRHINYQNEPGEPVIYTDFLEARATQGAATQVDLFEEGDYEVALDYEIREGEKGLLGKIPISSYTNYRIAFRFSVRNGNCMVYPFDCVTGQELTNASSTENGFSLDLAKSRYLDVYVRREVLQQDGESFREDVRFNRPARDGESYTQEGIYTVTVHNRYTDQETCKVLYVGTDPVMAAYADTGLPLSEIRRQMETGERPSETPPPETQAQTAPTQQPDAEVSFTMNLHLRKAVTWILTAAGVILLLRGCWYLFIHRT